MRVSRVELGDRLNFLSRTRNPLNCDPKAIDTRRIPNAQTPIRLPGRDILHCCLRSPSTPVSCIQRGLDDLPECPSGNPIFMSLNGHVYTFDNTPRERFF